MGSGTNYLTHTLGLSINPKNDIIVSADKGLHFLGHAVTAGFAVVDRHTTTSVLHKVNARNISSYRALPLVKTAKNQLDWILLEKYVDI